MTPQSPDTNPAPSAPPTLAKATQTPAEITGAPPGTADARVEARDPTTRAPDHPVEADTDAAFVRLIDADELQSWILHEDEHVLAVCKPGDVVCHPSKPGPRSSLVGACREYTGLETLHLVARLDRETSGIVVMAKHRGAARTLQMALQERRVAKTYHALLTGEMAEALTVNQPLAKDLDSPVAAKVTVRRSRSAQSAQTHFQPLAVANGFTLAEVLPHTGRKHQIRAHAQWLGHTVVADKIYGPDDTLFLEFIEHGWTPRLAEALPMQRQALHCSRLHFAIEPPLSLTAALPEDMAAFCQQVMRIPALPSAVPPAKPAP